MNNRLIPVQNAWVKYQMPSGDERLGRVEAAIPRTDGIQIKVKWHGNNESSLVPLAVLRSGFKLNMDVQDVPNSRTRKSFGEGIIVKARTLGGRDQVLVDFLELGQQVWLPYENLRQVKGVKHRFTLSDKGPEDSAERFRLKSLAHALELWNENTGSLSNLDIDPLPHQIHLVHHILASGNLNWLIADDVGLGKTIETGMLMAALKQRGNLRRVLLITPAGLTKQWQKELHYKFKLDKFQIYGEDFVINETRHWKMYDHVIGSIDRLKDESHLESLLKADPWDLIVFDEGHRLTRRQYGQKLDSSQRFELAANLRTKTDAMILLSATPHQGMHDKFTALLELLHPERKDEITTLSLNPEILSDMVFRNHKADVTDANGDFIFRGKTTKALRVMASSEAKAFDETLQSYLKQGYAAGKSKGVRGNTIGFVMTVYRKLAASSVAAIQSALKRRKDRLQGEYEKGYTMNDFDEKDQRYAGEWEEQLATEAKEFFDGEMALLNDLLTEAAELRANDCKLQLFMQELVETVLAGNPQQKILIFTEYRNTQNYLKDALQQRFGEHSVELINGSMPHQDRQIAINKFEENTQFLISTEAGGEGINLQRQCHILVNYDLPWNPMRLVQRIGRLYRYGQDKRVVVFNIPAPGTVDEQIMSLMYTRIDQVVADLCVVGGDEFNEKLQDDILGEIADLVEVKQILNDATEAGIERTQQRIDEALQRAKEATEKQRELFQNASSYDPSETRNELAISKEHSIAFVTGMFKQLHIEIVETSHSDTLWHIRLPENVQQELNSKRSRYEVTLDRQLAARRPGTHILDLDFFLMQYLLDKAKAYDFMGLTAVLKSDSIKGQAVFTGLLRWQNDQGNRLRQEYTAYQVLNNGKVVTNSPAFSEWLKQEAVTGQVATDKALNQELLQKAERAADKRLAEVSNQYLQPENNQWVTSGWIEN
ncbi:MAG: DEAD/DEAH box helicase [Methylobacter sp.]